MQQECLSCSPNSGISITPNLVGKKSLQQNLSLLSYLYIKDTYLCISLCICLSLSLHTHTYKHTQLLLLLLFSHWVMSKSFVTPLTVAVVGLQPTRLLCPWDFPGENTGVGCRFLLQSIFLTQGSNPGLQHCWQILYLWATREEFYISTCIYTP